MAAKAFSVAARDVAFEILKGTQIEGRVGKDAHDTHGESAVICGHAPSIPHLLRRGPDQAVAVEAAGDGFALHAELQRVDGIYGEL